MSVSEAGSGTPTKLIAVAVVAVVIVVAVVASGGLGPNLDAIIENKDCDAALALTEEQLESGTIKQQAQIGILLGTCVFGG